MNKLSVFLSLAERLNRQLQIIPLLYGSLGLEQRLQRDLGADDIDILVSEIWLNKRWDRLSGLMEQLGFVLYDLHEHAFSRDGISVAFASLESLAPFAGIEIAKIPMVRYNEACYLLLDLEDYRKVYTTSSRDGYRKDKKNKDDSAKLRLIDQAQRESFEKRSIHT